MPYTFNNTDGSRTITVADGVVDTTTYSLALVGRNVSNFGTYFAQNSVKHLENFASATAPSPSTALTGQLWYDKSERVLRVFDGVANVWARATNIVAGATAPTDALTAGTAFFNTTDDKLRIYDGSAFKLAGYPGEISSAYSATASLGSPTNYGTKLRNIYLKDSLGIDRAVLALTYANDSANGSINQGTTATLSGKETIMAIFSDHADFIIQNAASNTEGESVNWYAELTDSNSIGSTIRPGLNLRSEYDATALALASRAYRADAAYKLNTGSFGADSANIDAANVIHINSNYIPASNNTLSIGSSSFRFVDTYTGALFLGNGTVGSITPSGNVAIGNATNRINTIHTTELNVSGNVSFATGIATDAVSTNTANTLVLRDSNGSFAANIVSATATSALYADLAEVYASDDDYAPGTVVKLGGSAEITVCDQYADTAVFGVISTTPAYLMNSTADGLPVALQGRVPVKVIGPVQKGQRLVSSDHAGLACAANDDVHVMSIIGRSLENKLSHAEGVIEAVIGVK
jgi:hypothetical protein